MLRHLTAAELVDFIGMIGFIMAGLMAAVGKKVDPVGVFVAMFATGFGGGFIRDLILDLRPFYWIKNSYLIGVIVVLTLLAPKIKLYLKIKWQKRIWIWADAVGLAFFAAGSTAQAASFNNPMIVCVIVGVITAVFGGLMRDVFFGVRPNLMYDKQPYAAVAFLGGFFYFACVYLGLSSEASVWLASAFIMAVRMLTYYFKFASVSYKDDNGKTIDL